jgi:hypothetical protein
MIIGINGKIGVGKDTVGAIIKGLLLTNKNQSSEIKKFAGKLKEIASILTGIPIEKFEDQEFKNTNLSSEWDYQLIDKDWINGKPVLPILKLMTVRTLLQKLGTEAMREGLHKNVWVNALFADYRKEGGNEGGERVASDGGYYSAPSYKGQYPNWIITDMRFPNEMESVVERSGITIRVVRDSWKPNPGDTILIKVFSDWSTITYTHTDDEGNHYGVGIDGYKYKSNQIKERYLHPSETALDDAKFDYEIINDGTMEDLVKKVKEILVKEQLI